MIEIKNSADTKRFKISNRLLIEEALKKHYKVTFFPGAPSSESGLLRCEKDGKELFFKSTTTSLTPSYGFFAAEDKALTYSLLSANDVSTPETVTLSPRDPLSSAFEVLKEFEVVVVKPVDTNHGDGISIGVKTKKQLKKAITFARNAGGRLPDVLIQRQVEGDEYRFLVVEGKVAAIAGRRPPSIVGDGTSTIQQLIQKLNEDPLRGEGHSKEMTKINIEDVAVHKGKAFLRRVVAEGERVNVLETSNLSRGGESVDVTDIASPSLKKLAVKAAEYCFLGVAGVDIMTKDITADTAEDSYVIEVNLGPGLRMHQFPGEGKPRDVAKIIFKAIEKTARTIDRRVSFIGRSEKINLIDHDLKHIPARIDTGATVSSIWASSIEEKGNTLSFVLFDTQSKFYTGKKITVENYSERVVSSSMGHTQVRYQVEFLISVHGRKIRAKMTLADRSTQIYPILIGRNVLKNKFIVNVATGKPLKAREQEHRKQLDALKKGE